MYAMPNNKRCRIESTVCGRVGCVGVVSAQNCSCGFCCWYCRCLSTVEAEGDNLSTPNGLSLAVLYFQLEMNVGGRSLLLLMFITDCHCSLSSSIPSPRVNFVPSPREGESTQSEINECSFFPASANYPCCLGGDSEGRGGTLGCLMCAPCLVCRCK